MFLLFHTALSKCFLYSRVGILDSPMVQQSLLPLPRIRSRWFLFIRSGKSSLPFNLFTTYLLKSYLPQSSLSHLSKSGNLKISLLLLFLVRYPPSTTTLRFPHSSSMYFRLGKSTTFPVPSISSPSSSSSTVTSLFEGFLLQ